MLTRDAILSALKTVKDPELNRDLIALNAVKDIRIDGSDVFLTLQLSAGSSESAERIRLDANRALRAAGASRVEVDLQGRGAAPGGANGGGPPNSPTSGLPNASSPSPLPQVRHVIAVGAGKGGVGKSTVAVNLAVGLARTGLKVGLMDGDIYGPSVPTMLGIRGQSPNVQGNKLLPFHVHGIHAVTIGALVEQEKPLIWRGPMAHGAFKQLLLDNTLWPELDYLIVDLPPGTGDVSLTLCQLLRLTGAVVVATPQQVALDDAVRAVRMFQQLGAPILGIVENMSYLITDTGQTIDLFGRGGAQTAATRMGLPFLGALPMFTELRINSDRGTPHDNFQSNPALTAALEELVVSLIGQVKAMAASSVAPKLTIR